MSGLLNMLPMAGLTMCVFALALLCFCLRDYPKRRLEDICEKHQRPARFGYILRSGEQVLLVLEFTLVMLLLTCSWIAARLPVLQVFHLPATAHWTDIAAWATRLVGAGLLIAVVWIVLPWAVSRAKGEVILYHCWPVLNIISGATTPLWNAAARMDRLTHRLFGVSEPDRDTASLLTDELLTLIDEGRRTGVFVLGPTQMIHRLLRLHEEDVTSIMVPRTEMVTIGAMITLEEAVRFIAESGYSRIPVIRESIDDVTGILYAHDLLKSVAEGGDLGNQTVDSMQREVLYVPESQSISVLMESMRQKKMHMAIVVDEYSGVSGLVTMEDILEEVVGEISDEFDAEEEPLIEECADGVTEVDARAHIDDLNDQFGYELPEGGDYETVAGFLLQHFGRIPREGESCQCGTIRLTVLEAGERQVRRVRLERRQQSVEV